MKRFGYISLPLIGGFLISHGQITHDLPVAICGILIIIITFARIAVE